MHAIEKKCHQFLHPAHQMLLRTCMHGHNLRIVLLVAIELRSMLGDGPFQASWCHLRATAGDH